MNFRYKVNRFSTTAVKILKTLIIVLGFCTALASCYSPRYVYSPSTQNIPQLSRKGDLNAGAAFATGGGAGNTSGHGYNLGLDAQASFALSNHAALMINQYNRWEKNSGNNDFSAGDSSVLTYQRNLTEVGAGYYAPLKRSRGKSLFQLFGGVAFGTFRLNDKNVNYGYHFTRYHYSNVTKIFIQPSIIIGLPKNFSAAFSSRLTEVLFRHLRTDYSTADLNKYLLTGLAGSPVFFWEPAVEYSFSPKKIKGLTCKLQGGVSVLLNQRFVDYRTLNLAFGVVAGNALLAKKVK